MGTNYSGSLGSPDRQRGICDPFRSQTSSFSRSHGSSIGAPCYSRSHSSASGEKGGRKGTRYLFTGVLQPSLPRSEEERLLSASDRSVQAQSVPGQPFIQNGDSGLHQGFYQAFALGCVFGPFGRLFSRPHSPQMQEIPPFFSQRTGFPVQSPSFRTGYSPQGFHQTHGGSRGLPQAAGDSTAPVLRRLVAAPNRSSTPSVGSRGRLVEDPIVGSPAQPREIRVDSISGLRVRGDELSHPSGQGQGSTTEVSEPSGTCGRVLNSSSRPRKRVSFADRISQCGSGPGPSGEAPPSADTDVSCISVVSECGQSLGPGSNRFPTEVSPSMVDQHGASEGRRSPLSSGGRSSTDHRRQPSGLGSSSRTTGSHDLGLLVSTGVSASHQQPGDESSLSGGSTFPGQSEESVCADLVRQHDSGNLYQEAGRDSLPVSLSGNQSSLSSVRHSSSDVTGETHSRTFERPGGRPVESQAAPSIRVVSPSGGSQSDIRGAGETDVRLVCNSSEPSSPLVRQSSTRSSSVGDRCAHVRLDKDGRLCLSPLQPDSSGSREDQHQQALPRSSGGSLVAPEVVVQRPSGSAHRSSKSSSSKVRPPVSKRNPPHQSGNVPPSRVAVIKRSLRKRRFSERAATLISTSRRQSTNVVYDAKWRVFTDWCTSRKVNPLDPSPRRLADFFIHLFDEKELSISTIKGYRSTISNTLAFLNKAKVCHDPAIVDLIKSLELKRPVCRSLAPKWDLSCVLWSLTKAPYEPLVQASLKHLTWKAAFLLALASAKRRSELHALSVEDGHIRFNSSDGSVSLLCQVGFLAKTQLPSVAPQPFSIPSLSEVCGKEDEDRTLCPVRALKFYLDRVKPLRNNRLRLFIPLKGGGDVTAASMSRWVASVIRLAYSSLSDRDISSLRIRPHEVRALSTSWAFVNHTPLADILNATTWKSPSTFSAFYLRSFQCQRDNLFMLGPTVMAQSIIN